eukprot:GSA25T00020519001.1
MDMSIDADGLNFAPSSAMAFAPSSAMAFYSGVPWPSRDSYGPSSVLRNTNIVGRSTRSSMTSHGPEKEELLRQLL